MARRLQFAVVSAAALATAGLATFIGSENPPPQENATAAVTAATLQAPAPRGGARVEVGADAPPVDAVFARQLRRSVRKFVTAFLAYEVGQTRPAVVSRLRATASRTFAQELLSRRPQSAGHWPARARLRAVELLGVDDQVAEVAAHITRPGADQTAVIVTLDVAAGRRPRVTGLR